MLEGFEKLIESLSLRDLKRLKGALAAVNARRSELPDPAQFLAEFKRALAVGGNVRDALTAPARQAYDLFVDALTQEHGLTYANELIGKLEAAIRGTP